VQAAVAAKSARLARQRNGALISIALLLAACSSAPPTPGPRPVPVPAGASPNIGALVARDAAQLIGTPYRYGGDDPRKGFDCSGLVRYTHEGQGLDVPRTAAQQSRAARPVPIGSLAPGDLIFFRIGSRGVDHVGIYAGNGRFIHAPRSGHVVSFAYLDDPYYKRHMTSTGSLWRASARP
jgi:cell wall-associated NlpC family hydrolase